MTAVSTDKRPGKHTNLGRWISTLATAPANRANRTSFIWTTVSLTLAAVAGLAAATNPWLAVAGVSALLVAFGFRKIGLWRSTYAITLALLLCATSSQPFLQSGSYYPRYIAAGVLAGISYLGHSGTTTPFKQLPRTTQWLVIGMLLAAFIGTVSALWSVDWLLTLEQSAALIILTVIVYSLVTRRWNERSHIGGDLGIAYWTLTVCSTLSVIVDLAGVADTAASSGRAHGIFANPNTLAVLCMLAIPLGWFVYQQQHRKLVLVGLAPSLAAIVMTETRGALLGLAIGLFLIFVRLGVRSIVRATILGASCVGLLTFMGVLEKIIDSPTVTGVVMRFSNRDGGDPLNGRSAGWSEAVALIAKRPAVGYGYSAGPSLFARMHESGQLAIALDTAHNSYLQWMLETGVVGLPAMVILIATCIVVAIRGGRTPSVTGIAWCVAGGICLQVTESVMLGTGQAYPSVFWLTVAAGSVLVVPTNSRTKKPLQVCR